MKTISNIYFKGATKFIFVSTTKIGENTTNISKLLFFTTINLHFVTSNQITTFRRLNLSPSSSIYFVFVTSINAKKTQKDQSMPRVFLLCLKRNDPQTFKKGSYKHSSLQCVCYCTACFDKCFSFFVITNRHYFS